MLNELAKEIFENAQRKGFYENGAASNMGERLCLIHSEVSEALEAVRKEKFADLEQFNKRAAEVADSYSNPNERGTLQDNDFNAVFKQHVKDTHEDEIADTIIRCLDHCAFLGIDIDTHVRLKMKYNSLREYKHGKKF